MTASDFRRIALALAGAIEGSHMGHPDFRVNGRIFATLHQDLAFGMVKLTADQQHDVLQQAPAAFSPEAGAWGLQGSTRVQLEAVDEETLGEALTLAWQNAVAKTTRRPAATRSRRRREPVRRRR